ncbi:MAG: ABC transporter permease [Defluviitaleaceae bacterium]|nr:ABC transporter permease [Defluviitaleaceae bacterium]
MELLGILVLFGRFGTIGGWTLSEMLLPFAVVNFGCAFSETFFRAFDRFETYVKNAGVDRMLLRPKSLMLQTAGADFNLGRCGRIALTLFFVCYAFGENRLAVNPANLILTALMCLSSALIFCGVLLLRAALCFWTVEGLEVMNILHHGGRTALQYPLSIYNRAFRFAFTFLVPFGAANYYPLLVLLGKAEGGAVIYSLLPFINILFFFLCYLVWRKGIRRYASTGS